MTLNDEPFFGKNHEGFSFSGAGTSVIDSRKIRYKTYHKVDSAKSEDLDEDVEVIAYKVVEGNERGQHFKPILPLPEIVDVSSGEEDKEEAIVRPAKVCRYETESSPPKGTEN